SGYRRANMQHLVPMAVSFSSLKGSSFMDMQSTGPTILEQDPVTFEVVNSALHAICAEMKSVIMRTSFSPLLSLSADLSCALLDIHCNVIAQGVDIPVHLGAARFTGKAALARYPLD